MGERRSTTSRGRPTGNQAMHGYMDNSHYRIADKSKKTKANVCLWQLELIAQLVERDSGSVDAAA